MKQSRIYLWLALCVTMLIRLLSLGAYPLMDTTEARYGEMARIMVQTHNWLTPMFDYNVPFWGKPPLFAWLSALGIKVFGVSEFAVRFPHWLVGVAVLGLIACFARRIGVNALMSATILATTGIFAVSAGVVETDMSLTFAMTLSMVGFYLCWQDESKLWGYLGFVGLAIGLLAKGPLIIVLVGLAVMPWLIIQYGFKASFKQLWGRFPIIGGTILMLVIAVPWYVMAERATPGFLHYFLVGEYVDRFLDSGWKGDLYGTAHERARGTIWLYWILCALSWSIVLPFVLWAKRKVIKPINEKMKPIISFSICWLLSPLILFTFAGNILPAYVLPGIPALAILLASIISEKQFEANCFKFSTAVSPVILIGAVIYIHFYVGDIRSDKIIFEHANKALPTYYIGNRTFSGEYYSNGNAQLLKNDNSLEKLRKFQLVSIDKQVDPVIKLDNLNCQVEFTAPSKRSLFLCEN
ncbi:dolichyl-phosphate-mannose-protein mannosyltransferase [Photobacterium leiognathi lrivu.4.1]|uniref:Dolichyl-phosphate-mannose-protein mannosyltransferase n=1 Tax=Photobacterium leiognathi lrivu.4.1 TaxID=1248232 RepID=V5F8G3_PHOLE|nr:glycosyltransferase family 39 protein [Photobacterium leiognathi]GAD32543.1 dolichyl-phosphate-mannose-protein mannosyltransferase [Photobacterium leiognathi lrivu.4.1]